MQDPIQFCAVVVMPRQSRSDELHTIPGGYNYGYIAHAREKKYFLPVVDEKSSPLYGCALAVLPYPLTDILGQAVMELPETMYNDMPGMVPVLVVTDKLEWLSTMISPEKS